MRLWAEGEQGVSGPDAVDDELLAAYALDAIDDDERACIERHLAAHPEARHAVESMRRVAERLRSHGGPGPEVWGWVVGSLDGVGGP